MADMVCFSLTSISWPLWPFLSLVVHIGGRRESRRVADRGMEWGRREMEGRKKGKEGGGEGRRESNQLKSQRYCPTLKSKQSQQNKRVVCIITIFN